MKKRLSPLQLITISFAAVVLFGTLLLMLPISSRSGEMTPFIDALFTSASASCVTGLAVYDTYSYWTPFGQTVIICLIQTGGIGIITLAMYLLSVLGAKVGMRNMFALKESIGADSTAGVLKMTRFIAGGVLLQELCGAILLMPALIPDFGVPRGILYSFFHSISAFCNAGFDLMSGGGSPSLTHYSGDVYFNIVISLLIVSGGLGFFVWLDLLRSRFSFSKLALHSKIVVVSTVILVFGGAALFFLLFSESRAAEGMSLCERITVSLFQSVTARTAGFYTVDLSAIGGAAQMLMIVLMIIGGGSGSTAGGMKVTTAAVVLLFVRSIFCGKEDVECFGRRIDRSVLRTAIAILVLYIALALGCGIAISAIEGADIVDCLFESFSAMATVGLSLSLTPTLSSASKIIVIFLMFTGRVGGLTVLFSLSGKKDGAPYRYPAENVTVG
nr:Trk family potassium uptake protein [Clostridia bacterium]